MDYARFRTYLGDKYGVSRAFLFYGYIEQYKKLYEFLERCGYNLIFKPVLPHYNRKPKGNVDAKLVLHTMIQYPNFSKAVIVSGGGDFYCLADYLKTQNKLSQIIVPNGLEYSWLLNPFMKEYGLSMNNLRGKLEYKKSPV